MLFAGLHRFGPLLACSSRRCRHKAMALPIPVPPQRCVCLPPLNPAARPDSRAARRQGGLVLLRCLHYLPAFKWHQICGVYDMPGRHDLHACCYRRCPHTCMPLPTKPPCGPALIRRCGCSAATARTRAASSLMWRSRCWRRRKVSWVPVSRTACLVRCFKVTAGGGAR